MKLFYLPLICLIILPSMFAFQQHDQNLGYTHPAIVVKDGVSYISVKTVPSGTPITSTNYWTPLLNSAPTDDPGDPPTTEPDTSDSDLGNLTPPEDENETIDAPSGATNASSVSFVKQQYIDFLGREGAESGIQFWSEKLDNNLTTRADVVNNFVFSNEFQNKVAPVSRLYLAFFLRPPNTEGLNYWIEQNAKGIPLEDIASSFASSPEFITRYGNLTNSEYVNLVFSNVLERTPADTGLVYWTNALDNGNSKGSVMLGFSEGPEYRNKSLSEVRTIAFYYGLLRRSPAIEGFEYWANLLDIGASPNDLINGFLNSSEYQNRF